MMKNTQSSFPSISVNFIEKMKYTNCSSASHTKCHSSATYPSRWFRLAAQNDMYRALTRRFVLAIMPRSLDESKGLMSIEPFQYAQTKILLAHAAENGKGAR